MPARFTKCNILVPHGHYESFGHILMSLRLLNHLELQLDNFCSSNTRLPIVLPTLKFLHIHGDTIDQLIQDIHSIHAVSVTTLSLKWCDRADSLEEPEFHLPSLEHLILFGVLDEEPNLQVTARRFPDIERLTCTSGMFDFDFCDIFTQLSLDMTSREDAEDDEGDGNTSTRHHGLLWPKLHTVAVNSTYHASWVMELHHAISILQEAGHPISTLKLPEAALVQVNKETAVDLCNIVELQEFNLDWPNPFEHCM